MPVHIKVGSTWKSVTSWTKVAGVWKQALVWINVAGVWKQVSKLVQLIATSAVRAVGSGTATATLEFRTDGFCYATQAGGAITQRFQWKLSGDASSTFEIRCSAADAAFSTQAAAVGTWIALSANRAWTVTVASMAGTRTVNCSYELRQAAVPGVTLASQSGFVVEATSG